MAYDTCLDTHLPISGVARYKERFGFGFLNDDTQSLKLVETALTTEILPRHLGSTCYMCAWFKRR